MPVRTLQALQRCNATQLDWVRLTNQMVICDTCVQVRHTKRHIISMQVRPKASLQSPACSVAKASVPQG